MPRALWLVDVLRDAGLTVRPYSGWQTRGGSTFSPRGVMLHHTVTSPNSSDWLVDRMLAETGSSKVPPPLANWSTNRDGSVSVIAAGTANHGGVGSWNGISGNKHWFGDEMKNYGSGSPSSSFYEPWSQRQVESALRAAAAVLTHIEANESWLCGHKEYATPPGRKVDPHTLNMNTLRTAVGELLEDPNMKPPSWAREATQFHIDRRIYTEATVDDVDEDLEFHRQSVFRHRFYQKVVVPSQGGGLSVDQVKALIADSRIVPR